ncbi:MAG: Asp-tRNA(Asn)/Glu-tRNA(Gln) amidotransferase subunit GatB [Candidatus Nanopelagicales bacterium]
MKLMDFDEAIATFDPVMGLEVHVELSTKSKMFCGCKTDFGGHPNTHVCPVCLGLPGALPVVNAKAVESAIRIGLALNCEIASWCRFARKNYFYPDMPKNFQTSQYDEPLCFNGYLDVDVETDEGVKTFRIEIERAHMEEDTGKATHQGGQTGRIHGADYSLLDYNRAGIPLIEIVTKPIVNTGKYAPLVAKAYVSALRDLLRALDVSDVRMEQGSLRCDVNLSLRKDAASQFGTRSETKNVNSLRSIERAVRYEITRQSALLSNGQKIIQETRHWHENTGETTSGRSKEEAEDYRYFPEPDLVPIAPSRDWVNELRETLPENPSVRRARLQAEWEISDHDMNSVISAGALDLVVSTIDAGVSHTAARKWWLGELSRIANERGIELGDVPIRPSQIAEIENLISDGTLNDKLARSVIDGIVNEEGSVQEIIQKRNLALVSDDSALLKAIDDALASSPDVVEKIQQGKLQAAGAIVGAVMKATGGQADAAKVKELLFQKLGVSEG